MRRLPGVFLLLAGLQVYAIVPDPQRLNHPKNAEIGTSSKIMSFSTTGVVYKTTCNSHEFMLVNYKGESYRVFPTASIAGQTIHNRDEIVELCSSNLCIDQKVQVEGERNEINGHLVINHASVTLVTQCK